MEKSGWTWRKREHFMRSGTLLGSYLLGRRSPAHGHNAAVIEWPFSSCCIRSDVNLKVNLPCMCTGTKTIFQSCVLSVGCVKINCDSQKDCGLMALSTLNLFRTQATLSGKQKRQLQTKLEFVQEVVKSKKVTCFWFRSDVGVKAQMAAWINGVYFKPEKALQRIPAAECQRAGHEPVGRDDARIVAWCRTEEVMPSCISHHVALSISDCIMLKLKALKKQQQKTKQTHWYLWFRYCRINLLLSSDIKWMKMQWLRASSPLFQTCTT